MLTLKDIMEDWTEEASGRRFSSVPAYHVENDVIYLVTTKPGLFVGLRGTLIEKYQKVLEANDLPSKIIFVDISTNPIKEF